jgi:glyoxylase-like metal-dependent hydrolase (beta-lactamase superfamily II)
LFDELAECGTASGRSQIRSGFARQSKRRAGFAHGQAGDRSTMDDRLRLSRDGLPTVAIRARVRGMRFPAVVLMLASACSSTGSKTPAAAVIGRAERFQIGALEAWALEDGGFVLPNDGKGIGMGHSTTEVGDVLAAAKLPRDNLHLGLQALLVKAGDRVILFDTGTGDATRVENGRLPLSLALAGVKPIAVTDIFISHAHTDHVGGLITKTGELVFPGATIHVSAPEWADFEAQAASDADAKRYVAAITSKVVAFEPGTQVLSVVKAIATQGHTPGHSSYEIGADAEKLFYLGDVAHHYVISVQRPAWSIEFDNDKPAAEAMRQATLAKLAADHTRVFAFHFPYPGIGQVVAEGQGLVWKAER